MSKCLRVFLLTSFALVCAAFSGGCSPTIGDTCTTSADCASRDSRVCDTSVPEGYCTSFDCERNGCPEESVCVDFGVLSACMRRCKRDECVNRDAPYTCRDDIGPVAFCYVPPGYDPTEGKWAPGEEAYSDAPLSADEFELPYVD